VGCGWADEWIQINEMQTAHSDQPRTMDLGIDDGDGEVGGVREKDGESDEADVG
jgi:hypothetical protein